MLAPMKRKVEDAFMEIRKLSRRDHAICWKPFTLGITKSEILDPQIVSEDCKSEVSFLSSGVSKISRSVDSLSAVSSKEFANDYLEEGEVKEKDVLFKTLDAVVRNNYENIVDLEARIETSKRDAKRIRKLAKTLITTDSVVHLYTTGLCALKECHETICFIASAHMLLLKSNQENLISQRIIDCFKDHYSALTLLHSKLLGLKQQCGLKCVAAFAPYSIDVMMTILPSLVESWKKYKTRVDALLMFQSFVHTTLLMCCILTECVEEEDRIVAAKSIFHIFTTLLPIDRILAGHSRDASLVTDSQQENMKHLFQLLLTEYVGEAMFKPSSLLFLQLQHNLGVSATQMNRTDNVSGEIVRNIAFEIANTAVQSGCAKRQFPVGYLDIHHYNVDDVSRVLTGPKKHGDESNSMEYVESGEGARLWYKAKYWLLLLLEDSNVHVRNTALKIIRHVMVTVNFIEKDRQYVMSLVTDCLSDDATFRRAMAVLVAVSHIYPLKDGAVRRVSNLTLKGSGIRGRMEVIRFLGECYFTIKGIEAVISILQTLCEPTGADDSKPFNTQCATSSVLSYDSEVLFSLSEWPEILKTLTRLKRSHTYARSSHGTISSGPSNSIRSNNPNWIAALWAYISESESKRYFLSTSYRSEGSIRFPSITNMKTTPLEHDLLWGANKALTTLLYFRKTGLKVDSLKGNAMYLHIHRNRVKGGFLGTRNLMDSCQTEDNTVSNPETGKKCHCLDCVMDKIVVSSKNKRAILNLNDGNNCLECSMGWPSVRNEHYLRNTKNELFVYDHHFGGDAVIGYYRKFTKRKREEYNTINDIDCITFPSHLGGSLVFNAVHRYLHSNGVAMVAKSPTVIGAGNKNERLCTISKVQTPQNRNVLFEIHVTHRVPTMYPIPIVVAPLVYAKDYKKILGQPITMWIQSKRIT